MAIPTDEWEAHIRNHPKTISGWNCPGVGPDGAACRIQKPHDRKRDLIIHMKQHREGGPSGAVPHEWENEDNVPKPGEIVVREKRGRKRPNTEPEKTKQKRVLRGKRGTTDDDSTESDSTPAAAKKKEKKERNRPTASGVRCGGRTGEGG